MLLAAGGAKTVTFIGSNSSTIDDTVFTFSAESIGTAYADRCVHVAVHTRNGGASAPAVSSVTVGGVSATINVQRGDTGPGVNVAIVTAAVATGTTADIVVTLSVLATCCAIGIWASRGVPPSAAYDTDSSTAAPATATLDSFGNGFCIGATSLNILTAESTSWTNITEMYDARVENSLIASGASIATTGASITPSAAYSSSASGARVGVFATF